MPTKLSSLPHGYRAMPETLKPYVGDPPQPERCDRFLDLLCGLEIAAVTAEKTESEWLERFGSVLRGEVENDSKEQENDENQVVSSLLDAGKELQRLLSQVEQLRKELRVKSEKLRALVTNDPESPTLADTWPEAELEGTLARVADEVIEAVSNIAIPSMAGALEDLKKAKRALSQKSLIARKRALHRFESYKAVLEAGVSLDAIAEIVLTSDEVFAADPCPTLRKRSSPVAIRRLRNYISKTASAWERF